MSVLFRCCEKVGSEKSAAGGAVCMMQGGGVSRVTDSYFTARAASSEARESYQRTRKPGFPKSNTTSTKNTHSSPRTSQSLSFFYPSIGYEILGLNPHVVTPDGLVSSLLDFCRVRTAVIVAAVKEGVHRWVCEI